MLVTALNATRMTVPFATAFDSLQGCVESLQYWFWDNGLLLNPNKSAVAYFGTFAVYYMAICNNVDWKQYSDF